MRCALVTGVQTCALPICGEPITLEVVKDSWSDILKTCVANANDGCDVNFRTFNDAGFKISGEPGATYNFILLASPEHVIEAILEIGRAACRERVCQNL